MLDEDRSRHDDGPDESAAKADWRVDVEASRARLRGMIKGPGPQQRDAGMLLFTDEQARQRRLPEDLSQLSSEEVAAAAQAMSYELGAPEPGYAQIAAVEHLNELHASGAVGDESYLREKRRLLGQR